MRHGKAFRKLNRTASHRRAMLRNMVTSLIEHEKITTTDARAKELRKVFERMVGLAKDGSLHARRQALAYVRSKQLVHKLFSDLAERYASRDGGYVSIVKVGPRKGDAAPMSVVMLVTGEPQKPSRRQRKKKAEAKAAKVEAKPAAKKAEPKAEEKPVEAEAAPEAPEEAEAAPEEAAEAAPAEEAAQTEAEETEEETKPEADK